MTQSTRMTSLQRREQLLDVGRKLFATKGYFAVSVEEIAAHAKVSKPIVYEHFGGKDGLYAVVVDREMRAFTAMLAQALIAPSKDPRLIVERTAVALLTYIEEHPEGFKVLVRDSPTTDSTSPFCSLLGDLSIKIENLLLLRFKRHKLPLETTPYYAQMLIGIMAFIGQYWATAPKVSKEELAAHIVNLVYNGLSNLSSSPELLYNKEDLKTDSDFFYPNVSVNSVSSLSAIEINTEFFKDSTAHE